MRLLRQVLEIEKMPMSGSDESSGSPEQEKTITTPTSKEYWKDLSDLIGDLYGETLGLLV